MLTSLRSSKVRGLYAAILSLPHVSPGRANKMIDDSSVMIF